MRAKKGKSDFPKKLRISLLIDNASKEKWTNMDNSNAILHTPWEHLTLG